MVDYIIPALQIIGNVAIIPIVYFRVLEVMQDLYHQQYFELAQDFHTEHALGR